MKKVGVVGFCMGGALSIMAAEHVTEISASAPFYGIPDSTYGNPSNARVPLQLHFGTKDNAKGFSDPEAQEALEQLLRESERVFEFYRYEGAQHSFANDTSERYDHASAELAHGRTLQFFDKYLN